MKYISILALFLVLFSSCSKEDHGEIDDQIIRDYLATNQLQAIGHASGLYYIITKEGDGDHPDINSTVEVKYKGYLTDGSVFDHTSGNETIEFPLKNLIEGWQIGIPLLSKGGEGTFFLPSQLGYGERNTGSIPSNSVLIFEIAIVDF